MPLSSTLQMTLNSVIQRITPVTDDVRNRKDYGKSASLQAFATDLSGYRLMLKTLAANTKPVQADLDTAYDDTTSKVLPELQSLINDNVKLMNMGQLSTDRTIMPSVAKAENTLLDALHQSCETLASRLKTEDLSAPPPNPIAGTMQNLEAELKNIKVA